MWEIKKIAALSMLGVSFSSALDFGSMGNTSAAMGGAGVALKHSVWGLYYNPALLSSDPRVKIGYSLGVGLKEQNLAKITKLDVNNLANTAERLVNTFAGGSGASAGEITDIVEKALDNVLANLGINSSGDVQKDLEDYLAQKQQSGDYSDLIQAVLDAVQQSSGLSQDQKDLLGSIAGSIDYDNLDFSSGGGAGAAAGLLQNITIAKGGDKGLDKAVNDITALKEIFQDNNLNVSSQNGVVLQISSKTMNEKLGSLGVALFASVYANMSIKADPNRMRLIVDGGGTYYELVDNGNSFSFKTSTKDDYEKYSLLASIDGNSDAHKLIATSFVLTELPVGYARTFYLKNGNLNLGIAGKFMNAMSTQNQLAINTNIGKKELTDFASLNGAISSNNFGIDVGALYEIDFPEFRYLTFGLVAKNINSPTFESTLTNITLKPQYRAGIGYNSKFINLAFDADLVPNDMIAFSNIKQQSQMIGGGIGFDFKAIDIRLGAMNDLRQDTGLILTGGLNVLGFLDVALQTSTKFTKVENIPIPQYLNVRVGGSFSF